MIVREFTYYKNDLDKRAFLVASICKPGNKLEEQLDDADTITLLEWSVEKKIVHVPGSVFKALVNEGKLKLFIPKYESHARA